MTPIEDDDPRDYAVLMTELPDANADAACELRRVVAAVRATGKAGALTVKLAVSLVPGSEGMDNALVVKPTVTAAVPKTDARSRVFFADSDNNPVRNDPNQMPLFNDGDLKEAPAHDPRTGEVKEV